MTNEPLPRKTIWDKMDTFDFDGRGTERTHRSRIIEGLMESLSSTKRGRLDSKWTTIDAKVGNIREDGDDVIIELESEGLSLNKSRLVINWKTSDDKQKEAYAEIVGAEPVTLRISNRIESKDLPSVGEPVTVCDPTGGSDSLLINEVLMKELRFDHLLSTSGLSGHVELIGGIFSSLTPKGRFPDIKGLDGSGLSEKQLRFCRSIVRPGWHAVCGDPDAAKVI